MVSDIRFWYDGLNPMVQKAIKWTSIAGMIATAWRLVAAYLSMPDATALDILNGLLDLVSMPFRWALSVIGEVLGALGFKKTEAVLDRLIGDWDGDGKREGIGGEAFGVIDKAIG